MSTVYVILINVILLFIAYLVLNHKINKNSTSVLLDKYAHEVENLIVELNRTLDDVLNLSEERVNDLKKLIKKAEKTLVSERSMPGGSTPDFAGGGTATVAGRPSSRGVSAGEKSKKNEAKPARGNTKVRAALSEGVALSKTHPISVAGVPPLSVPPASVPLYDMRGKKVDVRIEAEEERHDRDRPADRPANILERTRHLLAMGHSKDEIAKMLNLSRAEMEFLASLHSK